MKISDNNDDQESQLKTRNNNHETDTVNINTNTNVEKENKLEAIGKDKENEKQKEEKESKSEKEEEKPFVKDSQREGLNILQFLKQAGDQKLLIEKRDDVMGFLKYVFCLIFVYFLVSPLLPLFINVGKTAWVLALLIIPIIFIIWSYIEYHSRREVWYQCLTKGIVVDLEKTDSAGKWICTLPMYFVIFFMLLVAILWAISYDENATEKTTCPGETPEESSSSKPYKRYVGAVLYLLGILFVFNLTKAFIDVEGAPHLLTLNMFIHLLGDKTILNDRGYKIVHYSQLGKYILERDQNKEFSWNEIYALGDGEDPDGVSKWNLYWGWKTNSFLSQFKEKLE